MRVLGEAGFTASEIPTMTFGDLDSLLIAELIVVAETLLGRDLAIDAFEFDTPVSDLFVLVA